MTANTTFDVIDKWTGDVIAQVPMNDAAATRQALEDAQDGFLVWSKMPTHERVEILERFVDFLEAEADELAELLSRESGKTRSDAVSEIQAAGRIFKGFAGEALRLFGEAIPLDRQAGLEGDLMITKHEPLGVVAAIIAFNFPAELYAHKVAAALAAGNSVVVKPAESNPLVGRKLTELLHLAGVPKNAVIVVNGDGRIVGRELSSSPLIRAISFTGSYGVGVEIAEAAAPNMTRTFMELSANDALIVLDDADLDIAVRAVLDGRLLANGQVCCATKRIIVQRGIAEEFTRRLRDGVAESARRAARPDDGMKLGPLISAAAAERLEAQIDAAVQQGAIVLDGNERDGAFYSATVIEVPMESDVAIDEELFGPIFSIIVVDDDDAALRVSNRSAYGLTGAVISRDIYRAYRIADRLEAAIVSINGSNNYRPDGSAFGGYKRSGIGREGYLTSLHEYTQVKSISLRGIRGDIVGNNQTRMHTSQ